MTDIAATAEGLAVDSKRTRMFDGIRTWREKKFPARQRAAEVVAPVATGDDVRLDEGALEVADKAPVVAELTRETFASASDAEIIAFLKGLDVDPIEGADRPEAESGEFGFFGVKLTNDEKAAVLRLRTGASSVEAEEDTTAADVALLKAKFAVAPAAVEVVAVDEVAEALARAAQSRADLLALADRFAIGTKDRGTLAGLAAADASFSSDAQSAVEATLSAMRAQLEGEVATEAADEEAPVPLRLSEEAEGRFNALIASLEAAAQDTSASIETGDVVADDREEVVIVEAEDGEHDKRGE